LSELKIIFEISAERPDEEMVILSPFLKDPEVTRPENSLKS